MADFPEFPIRIEAAAFNNKPVYFKIVTPWDSPSREAVVEQNIFRKYGTLLLVLIVFVSSIGSFFLAYRNLKQGRGDLRGGSKLTLFAFFTTLIGQLVAAHHVPTLFGELSIIYEALSYSVIFALFIGLSYVALEPYLRREWPKTQISWNRLLAGDFRNPMIGRDVLVGGLLGIGHAIGIIAGVFATTVYVGDFNFVLTDRGSISGILFGGFFGQIVNNLVIAIAQGMIVLFVALLVKLITKRENLSAVFVGLLYFTLTMLLFIFTSHWMMTVTGVIAAACLAVALRFFGLLGVISFWFFFALTYFFPVTFDTSRFYFSTSLMTIICVLGIASAAYHVSIAGQPAFGSRTSENI